MLSKIVALATALAYTSAAFARTTTEADSGAKNINNPDIVTDSAERGRREIGDEFIYKVMKDSSCYTTNPQQGRPPDGNLKKGLKVRLLEGIIGDYFRAESENGIICYVRRDVLKTTDTMKTYMDLFKLGGTGAVWKRIVTQYQHEDDPKREMGNEIDRLERAGWSINRNPNENMKQMYGSVLFEPPKDLKP